jgi:hypothetical protein
MADLIPVKLHALLSASGSKKWLTCAGSATLEATFPDEESPYAAEGTFAHAVFEHEMSARLGKLERDLAAYRDSEWWSEELYEHVCSAADALENLLATIARNDMAVLLEQRVDYSRWVPEGFGTGDVLAVAGGTLLVADLKYGKGVAVDAVGNSQLRLYGLGAVQLLGDLYDIERVRMLVLQPRMNNYSAEELTLDELVQWADDYVAPRARRAFDGVQEYVPGEHCSSGFCKARFTCATRAQHALSLARSEFALREPETLTQEQILQVLSRGDEVVKWVTDVQGWAQKQAEQGRQWPGYKIVEGRSIRRVTDPEQAAAALVAAGYPEALLWSRSLVSLGELEKLVGKAKLPKLLGDLIQKPAGKPALVPEADKRPAITSAASAAADFKED